MPKLQEEQLAQITNKIVEIVNPEFIICYGCRITEMKDWGSFIDRGGYRLRIHPTYDLLIVVSADDKRHDYEIVQLVEQQSIYPVSIHCIAHKINYVNDAIKANSIFYYSVTRKGKVLYNSDREVLLPCPDIQMNSRSSEWNRLFKQANHFLSLASHSFSCSWHNQAAFLLHQAVENACNAMIRFFTGYHSTTHNLVRLIAITETFSFAPASVFPGVTKEETELLNLLNKAYSDARYKDDYDIPVDKVGVLLERVKLFLGTADNLHKKGIDFIDDPDAIYCSVEEDDHSKFEI